MLLTIRQFYNKIYYDCTYFLITYMRCLGYKHGTDCRIVIRTPNNNGVTSWHDYQLCGKCVKKEETKKYRELQNTILVECQL